MNTDTFEMVAKTFRGLEDVLAEELRAMGALNVEAGRRMVAFEGDKEMLYRANFGCRTALRILKPFYKFKAHTPDKLYDRIKEFDWSTLLTTDKTFAIDVTVNSEDFTNSRFVTYRVKDAIADWFRDRSTDGKRPGVRLTDADVMLNVHISGSDVTVSLDSSGESLHKRGWRAAQTEAPINEVLAAGIILKSGWRGQAPLIDPMCGSGTFLIEAALIAANIAPGVYRKSFAFERWKDFDQELFDKIYQDDSAEREVTCPILGGDLSPKAIAIATENIKSAGVSKYVSVECKPLSQWNEVPANGFMITNPPYGERLKPADLDGLYGLLGEKLKHVFTGYHAWIIGYQDEHFAKIGLAPSSKEALLNGSLECELREYVIFDGDMRSFRRAGGAIKHERPEKEHGKTDKKGKFSGKGKFAGKGKGDKRKPFDRKHSVEEEKPAAVAPSSENPLASRRNPEALKYVIGRTPKLSARKGWRRKSSSSSSENDNSNPSENN
jgi:putative N6-adenine-specific DNA methylase